MELSRSQRIIIFALIALALIGLAAYLLRSGPAAAGPQRAAAQRTTSPPATAAPATPSTQPATPAPGASATPDIYRWLPFTSAGLASAARVAVGFGDAYGTYSYAESAGRYVGSMRPLISAQLAGQLAAAYSAPGVASSRASQRQVSAGSATISALRTFGAGSITFVVAVTQRITARSGPSRLTTDYAVTVSGAGTSWQVTGLQLATAGNS
jgi:hypothetical protein